jgi:hypothetical protein
MVIRPLRMRKSTEDLKELIKMQSRAKKEKTSEKSNLTLKVKKLMVFGIGISFIWIFSCIYD